MKTIVDLKNCFAEKAFSYNLKEYEDAFSKSIQNLGEIMKKLFISFIIITLLSTNGVFLVAAEGVKYAVVKNTIKTVSAGFYNAAAIRNDGSVWTWGFNERGALGVGDNTNRNSPVKIEGITNASSVDIGVYNCIVTTKDGKLYVMGDNSFGQYGDIYENNIMTPFLIQDLPFIVESVVSSYLYETEENILSEPYIMALDLKGDVYAWGANKIGILGQDVCNIITKPTKINGLSDVAQISVDGSRAVVLKRDGSVWIWGYNGQEYYSGNSEELSKMLYKPTKVDSLENIIKISTANDHVLAIDENGTVYGWGNDDYYQLCGVGNTTSPVALTSLTDYKVTDIYSGTGYSLFETSSGTVYATGCCNSLFSDCTYNATLSPVKINIPDNFNQIDAGNTFVIATGNDGECFTLGSESVFGALGTGNMIGQSKDPQTSNITDVAKESVYLVSKDDDACLKIQNINFDETESSIVLSGEFYNESLRDRNVYIFVSIWDNQGKMQNIEKFDVDFDDKESYEFNCNLNVKEYEEVRLYVWDGGLSPLYSEIFRKNDI